MSGSVVKLENVINSFSTMGESKMTICIEIEAMSGVSSGQAPAKMLMTLAVKALDLVCLRLLLMPETGAKRELWPENNGHQAVMKFLPLLLTLWSFHCSLRIQRLIGLFSQKPFIVKMAIGLFYCTMGLPTPMTYCPMIKDMFCDWTVCEWTFFFSSIV